MFNSGGFEVQRFRYWQGQKLRSTDLRDQLAIEAELRWWHNRALHTSFGVRSGFSVNDPTNAGAGSIGSVKVGCGVAYDCFGRELLLQTEREVPFPVIGNEVVTQALLVVRYRRAEPPGQGSCGCNASPDDADILWITTRRLDPTDGVPIARLSYESEADLASLPADVKFEGAIAKRIRYDATRQRLVFVGVLSEEERIALKALSTDDAYRAAVDDLFASSQQIPKLDSGFVRPSSRALSRPRIGSGETVAGETPWEPWIENVQLFRQRVVPIPVGMQVTIDTSAAGFTETPCYFAWLAGTLWDRSNVEFFPAPFTHIDRERSDEFRFRLWLPPLVTVLGSRVRVANRQFDSEFINYARDHGLHVCWLGIQAVPSVEQDCAEPQEIECKTAP